MEYGWSMRFLDGAELLVDFVQIKKYSLRQQSEPLRVETQLACFAGFAQCIDQDLGELMLAWFAAELSIGDTHVDTPYSNGVPERHPVLNAGPVQKIAVHHV
jgi:hypothetical protein